MKLKIQFFLILNLFSAGNTLIAQETQNDEITIKEILSTYQKAINTNNFDIFEDYFIRGRYNQYQKHKGKGNLLDWRGSGAIDDEEGKLIAEKFIYANDFGQL